MKQIQLLDTNTINKIAAGEVVERPASVVKELVENAIDADASAITVEIKDGGISLIRITDNGTGIPKEQVKTAFLRHATSKIQTVEDLMGVLSLGFRGEALASIAAVAQVEMITKIRSALTGTRIEIHGGRILEDQDVGCPEGTTIIVRNLFFNTPARKKFLKKPPTEGGYISDMIQKIALGHPEIAFKFINNGSVVLHTPGNNKLQTAVFNVYGKEVVQKMMPIEAEEEAIRLSGFLGRPELHRANRSYGNLFINGRFIKSELVQSAVEEAYKTRLPIGKFPVYVLHLTIDPTEVDVNVHPTKLEVRFHHEEEVYQSILRAISRGFQEETLIPKVTWDAPKPQAFKPEPVQERIPEPFELPKKSAMVTQPVHTIKPDPVKTIKPLEPSALPSKKETPMVVQEAKAEPLHAELPRPIEAKPFFRDFTIIGQLFKTYWIIEQDGSMFLIDQHAAHERVLYEKLMQAYQDQKPVSQRLLQPIIVDVSMKEQQVIQDNRELLEGFGFEMEEFGELAYAIRSVPIVFQKPAGGEFFTEILDTLIEGNIQNIYEAKLDAIATLSCKAAVKGMDRLTMTEAKNLVEQLLTLDNPFNCPHGRPTIIEMTKYELEKKFKRIQ